MGQVFLEPLLHPGQYGCPVKGGIPGGRRVKGQGGLFAKGPVVPPVLYAVNAHGPGEFFRQGEPQRPGAGQGDIDGDEAHPGLVAQQIPVVIPGVVIHQVVGKPVHVVPFFRGEEILVQADIVVLCLAKLTYFVRELLDLRQADGPGGDFQRLAPQGVPEALHVRILDHGGADEHRVVVVVFDQPRGDQPGIQQVLVIPHPVEHIGVNAPGAQAHQHHQCHRQCQQPQQPFFCHSQLLRN